GGAERATPGPARASRRDRGRLPRTRRAHARIDRNGRRGAARGRRRRHESARMTGAVLSSTRSDLGERFERILGQEGGSHRAVVVPDVATSGRRSTATPPYLFLSEIFIRLSKEQRAVTDHLCLVSIETLAGNERRRELHVVVPGALRSRSSVIAPGLLVGM